MASIIVALYGQNKVTATVRGGISFVPFSGNHTSALP